MMTRIALLFLATLALTISTSDAFAVRRTTSSTTATSISSSSSTIISSKSTRGSTSTTRLAADGTGGWGPNARKIVKEEYATGDRNAFEGYTLQERGVFMRQVKQDGEDLKNSEMAELLGVANIAGINVKDPKSRLNKFDLDIDGNNGGGLFGAEDDDDLDVSVQWEAKDPFGN
jgi:hypothetical protein